MSALPSVYAYPPPDFLDHTDERPACAGRDPNLFFPDTGRDSLHAKRICFGCPLREECLEWALFADVYGIWGGLTRSERSIMRWRRRQDARRALSETRSYNMVAR